LTPAHFIGYCFYIREDEEGRQMASDDEIHWDEMIMRREIQYWEGKLNALKERIFQKVNSSSGHLTLRHRDYIFVALGIPADGVPQLQTFEYQIPVSCTHTYRVSAPNQLDAKELLREYLELYNQGKMHPELSAEMKDNGRISVTRSSGLRRDVSSLTVEDRVALARRSTEASNAYAEFVERCEPVARWLIENGVCWDGVSRACEDLGLPLPAKPMKYTYDVPVGATIQVTVKALTEEDALKKAVEVVQGKANMATGLPGTGYIHVTGTPKLVTDDES